MSEWRVSSMRVGNILSGHNKKGGNQNGKDKKQTGVYERTAHCT